MAKSRVKKPVAKGARKPAAKLTTRKAPARIKPKPKPVAVVKFEPRERSAEEASTGGGIFPVEIDPRRIDETLNKIKGEVMHWANKGRHTKVRFKFRGKQLLPDLPLAAVVAAEGLTFYWGGILRALVFNIAGKAVLDVELVNDSEKLVIQGREALMLGDIEGALDRFKEALSMQRDSPTAHLQIGIALRMKGDLGGAREALEKARSLDRGGPVGIEADRVLSGIRDTENTQPLSLTPIS